MLQEVTEILEPPKTRKLQKRRRRGDRSTSISSASSLIGKFVIVRLDDRRWYQARVRSYDSIRGKFCLRWDDASSDWVAIAMSTPVQGRVGITPWPLKVLVGRAGSFFFRPEEATLVSLPAQWQSRVARSPFTLAISEEDMMICSALLLLRDHPRGVYLKGKTKWSGVYRAEFVRRFASSSSLVGS